MAHPDIKLTEFENMKVKHDQRRNSLEVRFYFNLNNTIKKHKQVLAILYHNKFEYWVNVGWVGQYSDKNLNHLKKIDNLLNS